jgi:hypothetical protein
MEIKSKCRSILFFGFLGTVILGTLFHFAFSYSGYSTIVGAFTPVNESVWEHLKLLLFPTIIISVVEYIMCGKNRNGYIISKTISLIIGLVFIVTAYYTYTGASGNESFIADIIIFILSCAITSFLTCIFMNCKTIRFDDTKTIIAILILTAIILMFVYFTFDPPMLELFRDPISEDFGIQYDI